MQTFVPYDDVRRCASVLDHRRLGKQRVECLQILNALDRGGGWQHHPAVCMWRGYEPFLKHYANAVIREWRQRGYRNRMPMFRGASSRRPPPWWGGRIHASHRSMLLLKMPEYYRQFGWREQPGLGYVWPV